MNAEASALTVLFPLLMHIPPLPHICIHTHVCAYLDTYRNTCTNVIRMHIEIAQSFLAKLLRKSSFLLYCGNCYTPSNVFYIYITYVIINTFH